MSEQLQRYKPLQAMAMAYEQGLDVTGCYRLMAVLLAAEKGE
jgi:predicted metal-binding membrane protein